MVCFSQQLHLDTTTSTTTVLYSRERVGEEERVVYGAHPAPPAPLEAAPAPRPPHRPQPVDPAFLTALDLEEEDRLHDGMLVTSEGHHHHDLNHNHHHNHHYPHKSPEGSDVGGRAAKYLVGGSLEGADLNGHHNYGYNSQEDEDLDDRNPGSGQDNYGYDPGYSSERSPEEEEGPVPYSPCTTPSQWDGNRSSFSHHSSDDEEEDSREYGSGGGRFMEREFEGQQVTPPEYCTRYADTPKLTPGQLLTTQELMKLFPFINSGTVFRVRVVKNLRGLGLALTGGTETQEPHAGLVRIKRLYPQTPAWLCGSLQVGDILLHANDQPLTGLTSHEALETLRTTAQEVELEVCRPPPEIVGRAEDRDGDELNGHSGGVVSTSLTAPSHSHNHLSPSPSLSYCGEFEVVLTKVAGSLGFTLRKQDNSILGHTVRSLVREPAVSDGRLRAGDKIIAVNNTNMCNLSHEEAIAFLRTCPETVTLRLYRDAMQTPVSPASPTEPEATLKPKPLRKEARDMLSDLAMRKQSPGNSLLSLGGAANSPGTPRRRRLQKTPSPDIKSVVVDRWDSLVRKTEESPPGSPALEKKVSLSSIRESSPCVDSQTDDSASTTLRSRHSSITSCSSRSLTPPTSESSRPQRPSFLDLSSGGRGCPRKTRFTPPHESVPSPQFSPAPEPQPTSAHSDTPAFSHLHQGYHSVNLGPTQPSASSLANTTSDHDLSQPDGPASNGLLKWKGVVFTPEDEGDSSHSSSHSVDGSPKSQRPETVTVELNRGWNSRLGFSLQPRGDDTIISAIYSDSVAARDGRLNVGDVVVQVNGVDVVGWDSESVIDLLRKTRGRIVLAVTQQQC